jgi:hypothetical protein
MIRAKKQAKRSTPRSAGAGFFGDPLHRLVMRSFDNVKHTSLLLLLSFSGKKSSASLPVL